jgi:hypothetical protein
MPLEYYLGGAVAIIVLVLLVMALTGKRSTRRVLVTKSSENEELTRQVARAADALEALLAHLKAHPVQVSVTVQQTAVRPIASPRAAEVPVQAPSAVVMEKAPQPAVPPASVAPEPPVPEPAIVEPVAAAEAEAAAASVEQKPRRVKLSMFGR